jgi:hypothetical protein
MILTVKRWTVIEGPLYEVRGGDGGPLACFDSEIVALTEKGLYSHPDLYVSGFGGRDEDGFAYANCNYKNECLKLLADMKDVKEIDTDKDWHFIPSVPVLEVRLQIETEIENAERHGMFMNYPYPIYNEAPYRHTDSPNPEIALS